MRTIKVHTVKRYNVKTLDDMIRDMLRVGAVFIGGHLTRPLIVEAELEIFKRLREGAPDLILGLEHFSYEQQGIIDDYIGGRIGWDELVAGYRGSGGVYEVEFYRPLLEYAREKGVRVIGLSPPREHLSRILGEGREALEHIDMELAIEDIERWMEVYYKRMKHIAMLDQSYALLGTGNRDSIVLMEAYRDAVISKNICDVLGRGSSERASHGPPMIVSILDSLRVIFLGTIPLKVNRYLPDLRYRIALVRAHLSPDELRYQVLQPNTSLDYIVNVS